MIKSLKELTMFELRQEIFLLRVLEESLIVCMAEDESFTDENATQLLEDTQDQLSKYQAEEYERKSRAVTNCS